MNLVHRTRRLASVATAIALLAVAQPAFAQDIADTHLAAARQAIGAMGATAQFDDILPRAAQALKNELIQKNPNLQAEIIEIVDGQALSLASRRGDLEREAATAYARVFSEPELGEISTFYKSSAGQKLIESGPIVAREILQAAEIWQRGIARDLAQQVGTAMQERFGEAGGEEDAAPEDGAAAADE